MQGIAEVAGPSRASDGAGPLGPAERRAAHACHSVGEAREQRAPRVASGGSNRPSGRTGSRRPALAALDERAAASIDRLTPPSVSAFLLEAPGSGKASRACVRARSGCTAPGGARTPARSHQHECSCATLAADHEVGGSETSVSSAPRVAHAKKFYARSDGAARIIRSRSVEFRSRRRRNTRGVPEPARSGRRVPRTASQRAGREATP